MTTWEYYKTFGDERLGELGRLGWELVAAVPSADGGPAILYYKRPARGFREQVTIEQKMQYYSLHDITGDEDESGEEEGEQP